MDQVSRGWAGGDVGKGHHWVCLIGEDGTTLWSSKVVNDERVILEAIGEVCARADQVTWAVDVTGTMSGLLLALLAAHDQLIKYVPGRVVNTMTTTFRAHPHAGQPIHRSHLSDDQGSTTPDPPGPLNNLRTRAQPADSSFAASSVVSISSASSMRRRWMRPRSYCASRYSR